jgi:hypothetical protein
MNSAEMICAFCDATLGHGLPWDMWRHGGQRRFYGKWTQSWTNGFALLT